MSNFKEGEGLYILNSVEVDGSLLQEGNRYTVIVLGDTDVRVVANDKFESGVFENDFHWHRLEDKVYLQMKLGLFSGHYINSFDVIIRDEDRTIAMIPNVPHGRC